VIYENYEAIVKFLDSSGGLYPLKLREDMDVRLLITNSERDCCIFLG